MNGRQDGKRSTTRSKIAQDANARTDWWPFVKLSKTKAWTASVVSLSGWGLSI